MQIRFEIPASFWGLFRSVNREIYIESLLYINEEYQYSNYFLTKEICVQILSDMNAKKQIQLMREEDETETDLLETTASRILKWLLKSGWLKKIDDYNTMTTNIVIPDYAAIFIEAFEARMESVFVHDRLKRKVTYRTALKLDCYKLIKYILEGQEFIPFSLKDNR